MRCTQLQERIELYLHPNSQGHKAVFSEEGSQLRRKQLLKRKLMLMAVFTLSPSLSLGERFITFMVPGSVLCSSQTKCPCCPAFVHLIPLIWKALWTPLHSLPHLCSPGSLCLILLRLSWGITFPGGLASFSSCLLSHSAPSRHPPAWCRPVS